MWVGVKQHIWFLWLLSLLISAQGAFPATSDTVTCAVCGMDAKIHSKIGFEANHEGKTVHFCSLSCALRFREKHKNSPVFGHDFESSEKVDTKNAYFIVKSTKVLKELEFGMPPTVVVFSSGESAKRALARFGDGQIVKGLGEVSLLFR